MEEKDTYWIKVWSKQGAYYYFNTLDGTKSWTLPESLKFKLPVDDFLDTLRTTIPEATELLADLSCRQSHSVVDLAICTLEKLLLTKRTEEVGRERAVELSLTFLSKSPFGKSEHYIIPKTKALNSNEKKIANMKRAWSTKHTKRFLTLLKSFIGDPVLSPSRGLVAKLLEMTTVSERKGNEERSKGLHCQPIGLRYWCDVQKPAKKPSDLRLQDLFSLDRALQDYTVIVLIGKPTIGKSFLGNILLETKQVSMFLDVGTRLRDRVEIDRCFAVPTESRRRIMAEQARFLLQEALMEFFMTDGSLPMLVTFVKEPGDVYLLFDLVKQIAQTNDVCEFEILPVCISTTSTTTTTNFTCTSPSYNSYLSGHDENSAVAKRKFRKWETNHGGILEVFASQGEIQHVTKTKAQVRYGMYVKLDNIENAGCFPKVTQLSLLLDPKRRTEVQRELNTVLGLTTAHPISPRMPSSFLCTEKQLRWLCHPGRYLVAQKVVGARHILMVLQEGTYLFDQAGSIYCVDTTRVLPCDNIHSTSPSTSPSPSPSPNDAAVKSSSYKGLSAKPLPLPIGTILDGVLLPRHDARLYPVFAAFDMLRCGTICTWTLPFLERAQRLKALFQEAVPSAKGESECEGKGEDGGEGRSPFSVEEPISATCLCVTAVASYEASPTTLTSLLNQISSSTVTQHGLDVMDSDGLVFTPAGTPYHYGPDPLTFTWQTYGDIKVDLVASELDPRLTVADVLPYLDTDAHATLNVDGIANCSPIVWENLKFIGFGEGFVFTCKYVHMSENPMEKMPYHFYKDANEYVAMPHSIQRHKSRTCNSSYFEAVKRSISEAQMSLETLLSMLRDDDTSDVLLDCSSMSISDTTKVQVPCDEGTKHAEQQAHPSLTIPFVKLRNDISGLVESGEVEQYIHQPTGLHVFSYTGRNIPTRRTCQPPRPSSFVNACRGLVLHPASSTVVAMPFVRFFKPTPEEIGNRAKRYVRASIKFDGSMIIAFKWDGQVYASTRRRMDSEQALWATEYLRRSPAIVEALKPGWTYLLELVGENNLHVMDYPVQQGFVFLTAVDARGVEVPPAKRVAIARQMSLRPTPALEASLEDIVQLVRGKESLLLYHGGALTSKSVAKRARYSPSSPSECSCSTEITEYGERIDYCDVCSRTSPAGEEGDEERPSTTSLSQCLVPPLAWEGWVVEDSAEGTRFKLVDGIWEAASQAVQTTMHPAAAWDALRTMRVTELLTHPHLPRHARKQLHDTVDHVTCAAEAAVCEAARSEVAQWWPFRMDELLPDDIPNDYMPDIKAWPRGTATTSFEALKECQSVKGSSVKATSDQLVLKAPLNPCKHCGCSKEFDDSGDRNCFCDSCKDSGCCPERASQHNPKALMAKALDKGDVCWAIAALAASSNSPNSAQHWSMSSVISNTIRKLESEPVSYWGMSVQTQHELNRNVGHACARNTRSLHAILRLAMLEAVRPSPEGICVPDLLPAQWLQHTFAKGWAQPRAALAAMDRMSWQGRCGSSLFNHVIVRVPHLAVEIFSYLLPKDLPDIDDGFFRVANHIIYEVATFRRVCRLWNHIISEYMSPELQKLKAVGMDAIKRKRRIYDGSERDFYPGRGMDGGYGS